MDQVNFVEDALKEFEGVCSVLKKQKILKFQIINNNVPFSNQITGFFDTQCLREGIINVFVFLQIISC